MSGAVGTQAGFGPNAVRIQELTMKYLGIKPAEISSQIVPRDRLAEFICLLALISSSLDKFGREIRNLQRTEIRELEEPFREEVQVGSSTMPQKRNPINSEKICGLAKILRSLVIAALENVVIEHERDLTNSSCERVMIPEACILLDEQLKTMKKVLKELRIYPENMKKNLNLTKGLIMSEAVMLTLVRKGLGRQEAHEVVRKCAMEAYKKGIDFFEVLKSDKTIRNYLTIEEIRKALNPYNYIGTAKTQIENIVKNIKNFYKHYNKP
jgi:adenylosuccinate lyase